MSASPCSVAMPALALRDICMHLHVSVLSRILSDVQAYLKMGQVALTAE